VLDVVACLRSFSNTYVYRLQVTLKTSEIQCGIGNLSLVRKLILKVHVQK
jgi:hypothetical protein